MPRKYRYRGDVFECYHEEIDESGGAREELEPTDGNVDAWTEEGSDQLMDFEVLARVKQAGIVADLERARKIARRAE